MKRRILLAVISVVLTGTGLYLVYGGYRASVPGNEHLDIRHGLFSPGLAMIGAGLYIFIRFIIFRK